MNCKNCNKTIADDSVFCPYCGTKTQRLCENCGAALIPDALFCPKCGTKVGTAPQPAVQPIPQQPVQEAVKPAAQPVSQPVQKAVQPSSAKEPFFKKWIKDNKEWADKNGIIWISEFVNGYAIALKNDSFNTMLIQETVKKTYDGLNHVNRAYYSIVPSGIRSSMGGYNPLPVKKIKK